MRTEHSNFQVELLVHGRPVMEYLHGGDTFIEGRKGSEYELRITNYSGRKAVAVVSVDGLSVMDGKPASKDGSGYVLDPFGDVTIPGWRLDDRDVARFKFGSLPSSYASRQGRPENVGVIGVVFFFERTAQPVDYVFRGGHPKGIRPVIMFSPNVMETQSIGTEFGRKAEHRVNKVTFERELNPAAELVIRYDEACNLEARGIRLTGAHSGRDAVREANPYPGDRGCVPPKGWDGRR